MTEIQLVEAEEVKKGFLNLGFMKDIFGKKKTSTSPEPSPMTEGLAEGNSPMASQSPTPQSANDPAGIGV